MDIQMLVMDGVEAAGIIRSSPEFKAKSAISIRHRLPEYQEKGLSLYEDMLELEAHGAKDVLRDIDQRVLRR